MAPILSIGITSYKRVNELVRCIESIQTKYVDDIEIVVSEDHSPLSAEIRRAVEKISVNSKYKIRFTTNPMNLGYDMNLGAIIQKCEGTYIFFMSDDDALYNNCLDEIIPILKKDTVYGVVWASFYNEKAKNINRIHKKSMKIGQGESNAAKYIYDSILFSGLIFRKEFIAGIDSSRFRNYNYFQVYLFLRMIYQYGGLYLKNPSVHCIEDGENAYGLSESSGGNSILANRESVKSNLEFNKTLFRIIRIFDAEMDTHIMDSFAKQYSLHCYSGLSIARGEGVQYFKEYWHILSSLNIKLYPIAKCYYCILRVFGKERSDKLLAGVRAKLKNEK